MFSSIWPIDRTLFGAIIAGQNGPESDGNEGVLHIPHCSGITGTSLSDCLVSFQDTRLVEVLLLCREAVGVFYSPSRLDKEELERIVIEVILYALRISRSRQIKFSGISRTLPF